MDKLHTKAAKEMIWRGHLARHAASGKSIAAFCRVEQISQANFFAWRTKLRGCAIDLAAPPASVRCPDPRLLRVDRNGMCVWAKRLEQGRLVSNWANVASCEMDWMGLKLLLEGIEPKQVRKRYKKPATLP